jgi:hypothetical protein
LLEPEQPGTPKEQGQMRSLINRMALQLIQLEMFMLQITKIIVFVYYVLVQNLPQHNTSLGFVMQQPIHSSEQFQRVLQMKS